MVEDFFALPLPVMIRILHIETSSEICSVCISEDEQILAAKEILEPFQHASMLTTLIAECLQEARVKTTELSAIAVSNGPGSYTALRVGSATAKGMCYVLGIPLINLGTLDILHDTCMNKVASTHWVIPMIDARRMEVYAAIYNEKGDRIQDPEAKIINENAYQELIEDGLKITLCGSGASKSIKVLPEGHFEYVEVGFSAKHMVNLALKAYKNEEFSDLAYSEPFYLKSPNITKAKPKL